MKMAAGAIRESPLREVGRGYFLRNHSCSLAAAHRGMKMYVERRRATTRVAPTMGLQGLIFVPIVHVGCHRHHLDHENGGKGDSRIAPTGGWPGVFSEESFMQPCGCTPWDENVCGAEAGNHKGCPYNGFAGSYFRSNRSCRLSPTPPIMKMAAGAIRESPLREVGRGYFLRNHSCSLAAAHRGMKMYAERRRATTRVAPTMGLLGSIFVAIVHVGCHRHHQS